MRGRTRDIERRTSLLLKSIELVSVFELTKSDITGIFGIKNDAVFHDRKGITASVVWFQKKRIAVDGVFSKAHVTADGAENKRELSIFKKRDGRLIAGVKLIETENI